MPAPSRRAVPTFGRLATKSANAEARDRREVRERDERHVVGDGHRQVEREHRDEVHAPDAAAHGDAAAE